MESLTKRAAVLIERDPRARHEFIGRFKTLYEARSAVVHGQQFQELKGSSEDLYMLCAGIICQFTHAVMLRERAGEANVKQSDLLSDIDRLFNGGESLGELPALRPFVLLSKGGVDR